MSLLASSLVHTTPRNRPQQSRIKTSEPGSYLPSSLPRRSGEIGWREPTIHSWLLPITRISNIFMTPNGSILARRLSWALFSGTATRASMLATLTEPTPLGGLEGKMYVPTSQRQSLLGSVHQVPGSGHPGSQRTLSLLQTRYWWPRISCDVIRYIRSCSVCAQSKTPRHLPVGKLVPLTIPHRPWSHIDRFCNWLTQFRRKHLCICNCGPLF